MNGLIKHNYYKVISGFKLFLFMILALGVFVVVFDNENTSLLTGFAYLSTIGLPLSSALALSKDNASIKWKKYILTLPVKRSTIVKSMFLSQIVVVLIGGILSSIVFSVSFLLHGFPFFRHLDVFLLFSVGIGISLLSSSFFFVFSYMDAKDRKETLSIISLLMGIGIVMCIITAMNIFIEKPSDFQIVLFCVFIVLLSLITYILSCFLSISLYKNRGIEMI